MHTQVDLRPRPSSAKARRVTLEERRIAMSVHVVLGAGPVGRSTARHLAREGRSVRIASRRGLGRPISGVEDVRADLSTIEGLEHALAGASVAYQCTQPAYHRWPQQFPQLHRAILDAVERRNIPLVLADNLYMYGPVQGALREDLPAIATTRKGRVRAQMAQEALDRHAAGRVQVTIVRAADFFGPDVRASAVGDRFVNRAVAGQTAQILGPGNQPHSLTYIDDFGRALALLGSNERAYGGIWHVANAAPITLDAFADLVFAAAGLPAKVKHISKLSLRLAGMFVPPAREMVEIYYQFDRPFIVDDHKVRSAFALDHTHIEMAVERTVTALKQEMIRPG
jgi:nucleoside-diphosphate-sugar epimerase